MAWTKYIGGLGPWLILVVILAIIVLVLVPSIGKEHFVPEFLDQGNVKRTTDTRKSSYAQQTNHFEKTPSPAEAIQGQQTPFRVNMFTSYM